MPLFHLGAVLKLATFLLLITPVKSSQFRTNVETIRVPSDAETLDFVPDTRMCAYECEKRGGRCLSVFKDNTCWILDADRNEEKERANRAVHWHSVTGQVLRKAS